MKSVSIIIPMYNSEKFLPYLFESLNKCTFDENDEIIIVDNGSTDNSKELCNSYIQKNKSLYKLLTYTEKSDSYAARNFGVKKAKGDILAFTDSDCKPTPEWITTIKNKINSNEVMAGDVKLEVKGKSVWELFDSVAHLTQCENNAKRNCVVTANMAVSRDDYFRVGFFEERFSGGDFDWSQRAAASGLKIVFHPEAVVYHPSRKTYEEIKKREQRVAYGRGIHHRSEGKTYITLLIAYVLRIFKLSTQLNYSKQMKLRGARFKDIMVFNWGFLAIRFWYIIFVTRGYYRINPRKYDVK